MHLHKEDLQIESGHWVHYEISGNWNSTGHLPTVFLNGLGDSLQNWRKVADFIQGHRPMVFVDLIGQGRALELSRQVALKPEGSPVGASGSESNKSSDTQRPHFSIGFKDQVWALNKVLDRLMELHPQFQKFNIVGYSYGGGVAIEWLHEFSQRAGDVVLLLPYIIRLDHSFPMQRLWGQQFQLMKALPGPTRFSAEFMERTYQRFLHEYMHHRYRERIPNHDDREVAIELSQGIMDFDGLRLLKGIHNASIHLVSSDRDTLNPRSLLRETWQSIPETSQRTWLKIEDCTHLVLDEAPLFVAQWLEKILYQNDAHSSAGPQTFSGVSHNFEIVADRPSYVRARNIG